MELQPRTDRRIVIITHNDLDGAAAAASYLRIIGVKPQDAVILFAEPYNVDQVIDRLTPYLEPHTTMAFMDIGFNSQSTPRAIDRLRSAAVKDLEVEWYDHHVWAEEDVSAVQRLGARLFVDRSTCGAGVVIRYASKLYGAEVDDFMNRLERAVCAADLWRWDDPLAPKLFRASTSPPDTRNGQWKEKLVEKFFNGVLWDDELQARLEGYLEEELANSSAELRNSYSASSNGCVIASVVRDSDLPSDSILGSMLVSRAHANAAALIKRKGFRRVSLSLRSRGVANVQVIARRLGGGGHPRASGASIILPIHVALLGMVSRKYIAKYVSQRLLEVAVETEACKSTADAGGSQGNSM
ncbi:DHH family phosphoesterase [Acidilobus sp.]|uniref:DHH family phosphoesterase n=1 Tax=Acidilobus sp. TaxID=1872109 RepID=UPI003D041CA7